MKKQIGAALAAGVLATALAACGAQQDQPASEWPEMDERGWFACYHPTGKFARYDDDADCDQSDGAKLYRKHQLPVPARTSGGMQTRAVPGPTVSHKAPVVVPSKAPTVKRTRK